MVLHCPMVLLLKSVSTATEDSILCGLAVKFSFKFGNALENSFWTPNIFLWSLITIFTLLELVVN